MPKIPIAYKKRRCHACNQTTTYALRLSKGFVILLGTLANTIQFPHINRFRLTDLLVDPKTPEWSDIERRIYEGKITQSQLNNASGLCRHGLIANVETGVYVLTKKGAGFLRGKAVGAIAIIDKATHSNIGYRANGEGVIYTTNIQKIMRSKNSWWSGWNYEISDDGSLVWNEPETSQEPML